MKTFNLRPAPPENDLMNHFLERVKLEQTSLGGNAQSRGAALGDRSNKNESANIILRWLTGCLWCDGISIRLGC
ncbi:MAG TPA: hypothetical protein DCS66_24785 [Flavobacteriaceae bacterium]|nr:hypothetical protein [Flavobacteriaceae bacterium]